MNFIIIISLFYLCTHMNYNLLLIKKSIEKWFSLYTNPYNTSYKFHMRSSNDVTRENTKL